MATVFGHPWSTLELSHVAGFSPPTPPRESCGKPRAPRCPLLILCFKHACGFANQLGGYLVLGDFGPGSRAQEAQSSSRRPSMRDHETRPPVVTTL